MFCTRNKLKRVGIGDTFAVWVIRCTGARHDMPGGVHEREHQASECGGAAGWCDPARVSRSRPCGGTGSARCGFRTGCRSETRWRFPCRSGIRIDDGFSRSGHMVQQLHGRSRHGRLCRHALRDRSRLQRRAQSRGKLRSRRDRTRLEPEAEEGRVFSRWAQADFSGRAGKHPSSCGREGQISHEAGAGGHRGHARRWRIWRDLRAEISLRRFPLPAHRLSSADPSGTR